MNNRRLYWTVLSGVLIAALLLTAAVYYYANHKLRHQVLQAHQQQTQEAIQALMARQRDSSMTLTLSLSENPLLQNLLDDSVQDDDVERLDDLVERLNSQNGFQDIWVQLQDVRGHSVYRSWTKEVGDSLTGLRSEVREFLQNPQPRHTISVGKFTMSFKSMRPVRNAQGQLLGLVEVITHFSPLTQSLQVDRAVESVLLVDKRYRAQLTDPISGQFVEDYYVVNPQVDSARLQRVEQYGVERLTMLQDYLYVPPYIVTRIPLLDATGQTMAHWLTFTPQKQIDFTQASWVMQKYLFISLGTILVLLLAFSLYMSKHQSDGKRRYYRQIIDSVSEIIYITNQQRIVDVNRHFFEFFDDATSIDEFVKRHQCVCEMFVEEEGYLQPKMDGLFWLEYVLAHPEKTHKAKILRQGRAYVFLVKVQQMQGLKETLYNVLMQDITQIEAYERELKQLTITDALTGVGNRLACNQTLEREIQRARRYATPLAVILYDLDHFKKVNDQYGHDVGDQVLKQVTHRVNQQLRETDTLCRFGGEEFLVVLPQTAMDEAADIAERLRVAVTELGSTEVPTRVTVSFGVAELARWDTEFTVLKRVDTALYQAKEKGRNRVELAE